MRKVLYRLKNSSLKELSIKIALVCIGVILAACGISIFYTLNIGSDPISVFADGQHRIFGISYGNVNLTDSIIYFIFILIFDRKQIRLATLIAGFAMGPLINLFTGIFGRFLSPAGTLTLQFIDFNNLALIPPGEDYLIRLLLLIPAVILLGCGLGLYLSVNMGAAPVDAMVVFLSDKAHMPFKKGKMAFDFTVAVLGFLMGGIIGIGTIAAIVFTGPIISITMRAMNRHNRKLAARKPDLADA